MICLLWGRQPGFLVFEVFFFLEHAVKVGQTFEFGKMSQERIQITDLIPMCFVIVILQAESSPMNLQLLQGSFIGVDQPDVEGFQQRGLIQSFGFEKADSQL